MSKRRLPHPREAEDGSKPTRYRLASPQRLRCLALASTTGLLVAVPLVPSESAAEMGTGTLFVVAWLLLAALWLIGLFLRSTKSIRFTWCDFALLVCVCWQATSVFAMQGQGHARPMFNMMWQWTSFLGCFFLCRQLFVERAERQSIILVMAALSIGLSLYAAYQFFVEIPATQAVYENDPEAVLMASGFDPRSDGPERKLFENRLYSTEPTATFALTNSLAGLMTPWFLMLVGIGALAWRVPHDTRVRVVVTAFAAALVVAYCLILTKSRTAMLASGCGLALIAWAWLKQGQRIGWRIPAAVAGLFALLLVAAIVTGATDLLVLSETPVSVLYRLQYWRASLAMIADHPLFGCGPGNFQQYYASYKLPEASETIADPHSFLFEVWATAGTPALLALLAVLFFAGRQWLRHRRCVEPAAVGQSTATDTKSAVRWIFVGAAAGGLMAIPIGLIVGFPPAPMVFVLGIPTACLFIWMMMPWLRTGRLPVWLTAIAAIGLLVNLSAAGGISFAGVSQSFWLLLALTLNAMDAEKPAATSSRAATAVAAMSSVLIVIFCQQTMYLPVLTAKAKMAEAASMQADGRLNRAATTCHEAAEADPRWAEPWRRLVDIYRRDYAADPSEQTLANFDHAAAEVFNRSPHSYVDRRQIGNWQWEIFRSNNDIARRSKAIESYEKWVELYPNHSLGHAQLAWAYHVAGQRDKSTEHARRSLELDALNPHSERKLSEQSIFDPAGGADILQNAEQCMLRLRKIERE